jgi:hypothetical protein
VRELRPVYHNPTEAERLKETNRRNILVDSYKRQINDGRGIPFTEIDMPVFDKIGIAKQVTIVNRRRKVIFMVPIDAHGNNRYLRSVKSETIHKFTNCNFDDPRAVSIVANSTGITSLCNNAPLHVHSDYDYEAHTVKLNRNGLIGYVESTNMKEILKQAHGAIGKPKSFAIFESYPEYLQDDDTETN